MRYGVTFFHDYFTLRTTVEASEEVEAIIEATTLIRDHYGWDLSAFSAEVVSETQFGNESACSNCGDEWIDLDARNLCDECAEILDEASTTSETA